MSSDRQTVCLYYICAGLCTKGRKADHAYSVSPLNSLI